MVLTLWAVIVYICATSVVISMSSVLVWSVESVLLGLWALVFSSYSTPLHVFVAKSHVFISLVTLILHLYVKSRGLVVGSAVSQAFVCAVTTLFVTYLSALLSDGSGSEPKFFKMPSVGLLTLDACIGLAWFIVSLISSLGMAFSFSHDGSKLIVHDESKPTSKLFLMFHLYGFHLVVIFPCLAILYGAGFSSNEFQFVLEVGLGGLCLISWIVYIAALFMRIFAGDVSQEYSKFKELPVSNKIYLVVSQILTRFCLITVTLITLFTFSTTYGQSVVVLCLFGLSAAFSLDLLYAPYYVLENYLKFPKLPVLDDFFGKKWETNHNESNSVVSGPVQESNSTSAPSAPLMRMNSIFRLEPEKNNRGESIQQPDPAAVLMNRKGV